MAGQRGEVDVLDHYRAGADAPAEPGVYRVVGTDDESVTLLRVAEDGRRVNSGAVVRLDRDALDALAPAGNPDAGFGRLRQVPGDLTAHPLVSGVALLGVAVGGYLAATASGTAEEGGTLLLAAGAVALWLLVR